MRYKNNFNESERQVLQECGETNNVLKIRRRRRPKRTKVGYDYTIENYNVASDVRIEGVEDRRKWRFRIRVVADSKKLETRRKRNRRL